VSANETKSHCVSRLERKKEKETKAAPDLHFEYVGMEEEAGSMLRHFRATKSSEFLVEMMGDTSTNVKRAVTEFWDDAQTLQPHRTVNSEGTVLMVTSMRASLSDAAVEEQFGAWLDDCTERTKTKMGIPTMTKWTDLNAEDIEYYKYEQFGQSDELMKEAAAENDAFAIYLLKAADPLSVSDTCKRKCQTEIDAVRTQLQEQQILTCSKGGILETAMMCMGEVHECVESKFYVDNQYDCWSTHNNTEERQLETEEETTEEPEGSLLLLSNHTEVMPVASRQTFEINGLCQSIFMFPLPVLEWQRVNYQFKKGEKDDHGNIIPTDAEGNHVTWTLPWCAQLAFGDVEEEETKKNEVTGEVTKVTREVTKVQNMHRDRWEKTKDAFDMWGDMSDMFADPEEIAASKKQINKVSEGPNVFGNKLGKFAFVFRLSWSFFYDPKTGPWKGAGSWLQLKGAVDIMARACIPVEYMFGFGPIPPPLYVRFCAGIQIGVSWKPDCPGIKWSVTGKGWINVELGVDLWVVEITAVKIELGLAAGSEYVTVSNRWCEWVKAKEGKTRRRYWDRRRRATKKCYGNVKKECTLVVRGWVSLTIACFRGTLEAVWYQKSNRFELWMKFEIHHFWDLWGADWQTYYHNLFYYKDM